MRIQKIFVLLGIVMLAVGNNVLLAQAQTAPPNLIPNPGLENSTGSLPVGWHKNFWGATQATFTYPAASPTGKAVSVEIMSHLNGDAKWYSDEIPVQAGARYTFSNTYQSTIPTEIVLQYTMQNGSYQYVYVTDSPTSSTWRQQTASFTVPTGAIKVTVFHLIEQIGKLITDNYSLTLVSNSPTPTPSSTARGLVSINFDDGWRSAYERGVPILDKAGIKGTHYIFSKADQGDDIDQYIGLNEIRSLVQRGHEIGAHSRTHAHLPLLSTQTLMNEIVGSKSDLEQMGVGPILTFAYPYGELDDRVRNATQQAGFTAARGVEDKLNTPSTDKYVLFSDSLINTTTFAEVKAKIDQAINQNLWYIIVIHEMDKPGNEYSISSNLLRQIVAYLKQRGVRVVPNTQGLQIMGIR
jgi:peptidoglycan/xylan/chitin deacetylase (PgdA/CDA1 family)